MDRTNGSTESRPAVRGLLAEGDARLGQVVGGHFDVDLVADADADEVFAHLAGNVGEDFMAVGQRDTKHRSGQHLADRSVQFNWLFFGHATAWAVPLVYRNRLSQMTSFIILSAWKLPLPRPKIKSNFLCFRLANGLYENGSLGYGIHQQ